MKNIWTSLTNIQFSNHTVPAEQYDICIIGAGMTGLYSALLLAEQGHQVAVFEAAPKIGQGATSFSTGKLTIQHGAIYGQLPPELQELYCLENERAIHHLTSQLPSNLITNATSYLYSRTDADTATLKNELQIYEQLHLPCFSSNETELPFPTQFAIALENQFQINPYESLVFLANEATKHGAVVHTNCRVQHIDHLKQEITVGEQSIHFQHLIVATHYPIDAIPALQLTKLTNSRSYLCAAPITEPLEGHYLDIGSETRTIRSATLQGQHYILYGGASHLAGGDFDTPQYYETLEQEMRQHFELTDIPFKWSNQDVKTFDVLPFVGPISATTDNIYIATGFRKWGLSQSVVGAQILLNTIQKQHHPLQQFFTPSRFKPMRMLETATYTIGQFLNGYISRSNTPICTHLGCHTRWNEADKTWDCPCHGSRFSENGSIVEGPAVEPLDIADSTSH